MVMAHVTTLPPILQPPLRWRLAEVPFGLDYPYWVDDSGFDLDFHVRELALPQPGSDEQLAEQVARTPRGRSIARVRCGRSI